jgi:branched-chain amino acid transport system permease protein
LTNLIIIVILILVPYVVRGLSLMGFDIRVNHTLGIICRMLIYVTLAGSLNAINGYSGQFCLGIIGFFAIGAYTHAILGANYGISFWLNLPLGGIFAAIIGLVIAFPTLKMSGIYLSLVTLGFSEIVRLVALNWTSLTGGPLGIRGIPTPSLFGFTIRTPQHFYYVFLGIAIVYMYSTYRVIHSRVGRAWMSIREDQLASQSLGVEIKFYKTLNFMYGAFWAGVIGAAFASYLRFVDSTFFILDEGFNVLSMVIIGGSGTLIGPAAGAIILTYLTEALRELGQWRMVAYALLIIIMMWVRPQGLAGAKDSILAQRSFKLFTRLRRRKAGTVGKEGSL